MNDLSSDRLISSIRTSDDDVHMAFLKEGVTIPITSIAPLKILREGVHESKKYLQIVSSIKAIGVVEAPVVIPDPEHKKRYFLLDGHLRVEALKQLGVETVNCLVATDEETYTYNKRINRLPPIQEHRMIVRAVSRGVAASTIADALGLEVQSIHKRFRLLDGICEDAADILNAANCSITVFDVLRRMSSIRQIEAAELMVGQNNFTVVFAQALHAATPDDQLVKFRTRKSKDVAANGPSSQQMARMERELAALQMQIRSVEDSYGVDNLHLTVAKGYIGKLVGNNAVYKWLEKHHHDYLGEFQKISDIDTINTNPVASSG
jgi:RepB plasmid partitioning protein/ParB-like nuclease domain